MQFVKTIKSNICLIVSKPEFGIPIYYQLKIEPNKKPILINAIKNSSKINLANFGEIIDISY